MKNSRLKLAELTPTRVVEAAWRRLREIPHSVAWRYSSALAHENQRRLLQLKDAHHGKRCFIIANGPSLNSTDLRPLASEMTIGMNRIYLLFEKMTFIPTYYVCVNQLVLEQFAGEIDGIPTTKFLNWRTRKNFSKVASTLYLKENYTLNDTFEADLTGATSTGGTVTFVALQVAFYLGFQTVYIVGMDHDFVEKGIPSRTEVRQSAKDESHFHPNYFPQGVKWQLPDLHRSDIDYTLARNHYQLHGRQVFDATIGGKCTVFPKASYSDLF